MNKTKNWKAMCHNCGNGKPVQSGVNYDLRAKAAIVHYHCSACGMPFIEFRTMTDGECREEARRILAEDEARRAEEAAMREAQAQAAAEWERERAEIIMQQRRNGGRA